ncbi:MAG: FAD-binding oxidoreductase [Myxococcales bacterium]|nr:FAD-binding oxidoreductase [Myxococcales bacterium]
MRTIAALAGLAVGYALAGQRRRREGRRAVLSKTVGPHLAAAIHRRKVQQVARQLREHKSGRPISLRKRAVAHQVPKAGDLRRRDEKVDISDLNAILHVDPLKQVCVAEPGVTFVDLVAATLRYGLVPLVVPELKTITIGGAVSGCSIESMSYKVGGFHDTCVEYEVIDAKGRVITCGPDDLLFQMIHGSFGTLGILSKLTFRLTPAKRFVRVKYEHYRTLEEYRAAIVDHYQRQDVDFMDGIIHSPRHYVLSVADFVDEAPYANRYDWVKVYYQSTARRAEDYLETPDYFFRYDRGVTNVHPKSAIGRLLLAKFLGSSQALRAAEKLNWLLKKEQPTIILDVFLPISKMPEFLEWYGREFRHFPLWCVPYRRPRDYEWVAPDVFSRSPDALWVDLAIYGMKQRGDRNYHKLMEQKLRELGGIKTLISHNYYTPDEFWQTWNRENYFEVKALTDPDNVFRDLYTKTCKAAMGVGSA